jgi:molecular chaperone GrpE
VDVPREARQPVDRPSPSLSIPDVDAELQASRARLTREAAREREADKLRLVGEILPVLDDLDRSVAAARRAGGVTPSLLEGFELVRTRLERVLEGYGLERIVATGARFDPAVHEAIALVPVEDPERVGVVVDEIERGYRAGDRVLRAARVRVGGR